MFLVLFSAIIRATSAVGATLRPTAVTGLMQQPSSQYYHLIYGGQIDIAKKDDAAQMRLQYLERPPFRRVGFVDQDFSGAVFFGKGIIKDKVFGVSALVGGGYAWGYIKEDTEDNPVKNSYKLPGIATALEARWTFKSLDLRATYQTMICQNSKTQLQAYVAWPFNWFLVAASMPVSLGG